MKIKAIFFIYFLILIKGMAQDNFIGVWVNIDNNEEIEIYKKEDSYYAKTLNQLNNVIVLEQMVYQNDKKLYGV